MSITTLQIVNAILFTVCLIVDVFYVKHIREKLTENMNELTKNIYLSKTFTWVSWIISFGILFIPVMWVQWTYMAIGVIGLVYTLFLLKPIFKHLGFDV